MKRRYAARVGGRGWLPPGVEAAAGVEGGEHPADLKESFAIGPDTPTGAPAVDDVWFPPNVWPAEVPELHSAAGRYLAAMTAVSGELSELCGAALGVDPLTTTTPTWTFHINRYPPLTEVVAPAPGQFRIGPHADLGTVTVLDREPGAGGLQVHTEERGWADAPYAPGP